MSLPLDGIRVLDASTILAGPLACGLLAEFGAEVIKIEEPGVGDPVRSYPPLVDGESAHWSLVGRNKQSVTIDLRREEGRSVFRRLVRSADVVVTNFRPSTLRDLGIDFAELCEERPDLVMVHISAFGRTGPYADRPGFARIAEAFAGLTERTGFPDGPPMFSGYAIADGVAGIYGAFSAMLALRQRERTGQSQLADIALYEPVLRMMEDFICDFAATGAVAGREGNDNPKISPNGLFPTADGQYVVLPASTQRMWERLEPLLGDPSLRDLRTQEQRVAHRDLINRRVEAFTTSHDLNELLEILAEAGVACGPVNNAADLCADPHIKERGSIVELDDPHRHTTHLMQAAAGRFSGFEARVDAPGARLGEHTDAVLSRLAGCTSADIKTLRANGIV